MSAAAYGKIQLELVIVAGYVGHAPLFTVHIGEDVFYMLLFNIAALQQGFDVRSLGYIHAAPTLYAVNAHCCRIVYDDIH